MARYTDSSCTDFGTFPLFLGSALHDYLYVNERLKTLKNTLRGLLRVSLKMKRIICINNQIIKAQALFLLSHDEINKLLYAPS